MQIYSLLIVVLRVMRTASIALGILSCGVIAGTLYLETFRGYQIYVFVHKMHDTENPPDFVFHEPALCSDVFTYTGAITKATPHALANPDSYLAECLGRGPVTLELTSPGGNSDAGLQVFEFFQKNPVLRANLTTVAVGDVSSSAVQVFLSGSRRIVDCKIRLMIHASKIYYSYPKSFTLEEFVSGRDELEQLRDVYANNIAQVTSFSQAQIKRFLASGQDTYFNHNRSFDLGFATEASVCN